MENNNISCCVSDKITMRRLSLCLMYKITTNAFTILKMYIFHDAGRKARLNLYETHFIDFRQYNPNSNKFTDVTGVTVGLLF